MTDRIDQLERLQKLRESGAINDSEFEAEKCSLLNERSAVATNQFRFRYMLGGAAILLLMGSAIAWMVYPVDAPSSGSASDSEVRNDSAIAPAPTPASASERLSLAVGVAFPNGTSVRDGSERFLFVNHRLVDSPFGPVLISEGQAQDAAHVTSGRLHVAYLREVNGGFALAHQYPKAVEVGSFGRMSEWSVSNRFSDLPVLYAAGGFTGQGITEGCSILTELRPEGPRELVAIPDYYSDGGALMEEGQRPQDIEGRIANIVRGQSFDVRYTGTVNEVRRYVRRENRFVRQGEPVLEHCGE